MPSGNRCVLSTPKNARKVVRMLADGNSQKAIAEEFGVARQTVNRWVNRDDIREWVNTQAQKYIESLPNALELSKNVLEIGRHQTNSAIVRRDDGSVSAVRSDFIDHKILDAALREAENLRKAVGITPSHSSSVVIGQLVMGNNQNILAPSVQRILDRQLGDILDAEAEDITSAD